MAIRKIFSTIVILLCVNIACYAQDPHFSQYFASPLTINPANAGFFDGEYRIAGNMRQQWFNVGKSYATNSASADFKILKDVLPEYDVAAVGVSGVFDNSLNGVLKSNYLSLTGAYHKSLANAGEQTLGLGFQLTYANRYFDLSQLTYASQFNVDHFDVTVPADVTIDANASKYLELNVGVLYAKHSEKANIYASAALYHTNRPAESLFNVSGYRLPFRQTLHAGGEYFMDEYSSLLFSGLYINQQSVSDELLGLAYGIRTGNEISTPRFAKLYFGLWYRVKESYIPYVGMDYGNFNVGVNYSMRSSTVASFRPQTIELSVIYRKKNHFSSTQLCPTF